MTGTRAPLRAGFVSCCGAVILLSAGCGHASTSPTDSSGGRSSSAVQLNDDFGGRRLFPNDNWWNLDISTAPIDAQSSAYLDFIGRSRASHPDFGPPPYGPDLLRKTARWSADRFDTVSHR